MSADYTSGQLLPEPGLSFEENAKRFAVLFGRIHSGAASPLPINGNIPSTTNFLSGDGVGGVVDSGVPPFIGPVLLSVKNISVQTTGSAIDLATIVVPSWLARYKLGLVGTTGVGGGFTILGESMAGTLAGASFTLYDAAGGGGNALTNSTAGPAATGVVAQGSSAIPTTVITSGTIYVRQTSNAANAGVVSIYLLVMPLL